MNQTIQELYNRKSVRVYSDEPISDEVPSTVLKLHHNFTVICDKEAASLINEEDYKRI